MKMTGGKGLEIDNEGEEMKKKSRKKRLLSNLCFPLSSYFTCLSLCSLQAYFHSGEVCVLSQTCTSSSISGIARYKTIEHYDMHNF